MTTHAHAAALEDKTLFGFWTYLMTDCVLFATLFATFAVLHNNTAGGPAGKDIFSFPFALTETIVLLTSSLTCGLSWMASDRKSPRLVIFYFVLTFLLGATFVGMELTEFTHLVKTGDSWERSAFLSSFFTLVGTHGLHVSVGLLWMLVMIAQILWYGLTPDVVRRLACLRLFWHFLDLVWVFLFSIVYLLGGI